MNNLSQDSHSPSQDMDTETLKYEAGVLATLPLCLVTWEYMVAQVLVAVT
jgi:hypothetical protein